MTAFYYLLQVFALPAGVLTGLICGHLLRGLKNGEAQR